VETRQQGGLCGFAPCVCVQEDPAKALSDAERLKRQRMEEEESERSQRLLLEQVSWPAERGWLAAAATHPGFIGQQRGCLVMARHTAIIAVLGMRLHVDMSATIFLTRGEPAAQGRVYDSRCSPRFAGRCKGWCN